MYGWLVIRSRWSGRAGQSHFKSLLFCATICSWAGVKLNAQKKMIGTITFPKKMRMIRRIPRDMGLMGEVTPSSSIP